MSVRTFGWVDPSLYGRPHVGVRAPSRVEKTARTVGVGHVPRPLNQGAVGSCGVQCSGAALLTLQGINGYTLALPDRPKTYYRARRLLGARYTHEDSGCVLGDVVAVLRQGFEVERQHALTWGSLWTDPPPPAPDDRRLHGAEALAVGDDLFDNLWWEVSTGSVPILGLNITEAWDGARGSTTIENPSGRVLGGHGVMIREVDPEVRMFRILNSWGEEFGDGGSVWLGEEWLQRPWCGEAHSLRAYYHRGG